MIPLDLDLGASTEDGSGGAARLHQKALAAPDRVRAASMEPSRAGVLLSDLRTDGGRRPVADVVSAVMRLVEGLAPPIVFYVRLLNPKLDGFDAVERFFRHVVDPVVKDLGYAPFETGRDPTEYAWMNEEIFDRLHYSSAVVVDVTGLRNNCFLEFGYALGRGLRVIVTAMKDTHPPSIREMVPHHFWEDTADDMARQRALKEFWAKTHRSATSRATAEHPVSKIRAGRRPREVYISVDTEAAGPVPGLYSMLALGACVVGRPARGVLRELRPITDAFVPEALRVGGLSMERLRRGGARPGGGHGRVRDAGCATRRPCTDAPCSWLSTTASTGRSSTGTSTGFWVSNPFGIGGVDIKAYYMGLVGCAWADTTSSRLPRTFPERVAAHTQRARRRTRAGGHLREAPCH